MSARATVPTMSSTRFRRVRSSREPGMVDPCVAASEGRGAGGGIGRRRLGSASAGAGLITSFHCSWRARGLGTTWLRSPPATPRWSDAGFRSTRTTLVVVSLRFFRKWLGRRLAFLGSSGLSSGCGTGLCLSPPPPSASFSSIPLNCSVSSRSSTFRDFAYNSTHAVDRRSRVDRRRPRGSLGVHLRARLRGASRALDLATGRPLAHRHALGDRHRRRRLHATGRRAYERASGAFAFLAAFDRSEPAARLGYLVP